MGWNEYRRTLRLADLKEPPTPKPSAANAPQPKPAEVKRSGLFAQSGIAKGRATTTKAGQTPVPPPE